MVEISVGGSSFVVDIPREDVPKWVLFRADSVVPTNRAPDAKPIYRISGTDRFPIRSLMGFMKEGRTILHRRKPIDGPYVLLVGST